MEPLAGLAITDGFIWRPITMQDEPELWLAPSKTGYRGLFERFARQHLGASGLDGAQVQIDHVFPKGSGIPSELGYVRMLAIPPDSNMDAGRTLEKAMVERNRLFGPRGKPTRFATYQSIGKATGFVGYSQMPEYGDSKINRATASRLMAHLRDAGLPPEVLTAMDQELTASTIGVIR